jgi:hypothetical protein
MSLIVLLAMQALGQEITTYYPLPSKAEQERELRQAQGLPPLPDAAKPPQPKAANQAEASAPKPPPEPLQVVSVTTVRPDASVKFVPPPDEQPHP